MSLSIAANVRECTSFFEYTEQTPWWITLSPNNHLRQSQIKRPVSRRKDPASHIILISLDTNARPEALPRVVGLNEELPAELKVLADVLNQSRWMLNLPDNWDDEGGSGYAEATWKRAARFLVDSAKFVQQLGLVLAIPKVQNGPEGTIDLFWETPYAKLLLNIPVEPKKSAHYYGHRTDGSETRGSLDVSHVEPWLLLWAAQPAHK